MHQSRPSVLVVAEAGATGGREDTAKSGLRWWRLDRNTWREPGPHWRSDGHAGNSSTWRDASGTTIEANSPSARQRSARWPIAQPTNTSSACTCGCSGTFCYTRNRVCVQIRVQGSGCNYLIAIRTPRRCCGPALPGRLLATAQPQARERRRLADAAWGRPATCVPVTLLWVAPVAKDRRASLSGESLLGDK